jgi:hypothetical protein
VFLIITELPLFRNYIARNWPLFSPSSGFVTLGITMIVVGVSILGNLNKEATSQESLGKSFWQIVISSGILVVILGVVNLFAVSIPASPVLLHDLTSTYPQSYIFRNSALEITARMVRSHGAVANQKVASSSSSATSRRRSFQLGRADTLPSYRTEVRHQPQQHRNISAPITMGSPPEVSKSNIHFEELGRPDLAHHPAMGGRI